MEKKRTNSGPYMESTSKHSIYTPELVNCAVQGHIDVDTLSGGH